MSGVVNQPKQCEPWEMDFPATASLTDILYCFRLLLGRRPGEREWPGHSWRVGEELSLVVSSYLNSQEFAGRHLLKSQLERWQLVELPQFRIYASPEDTFVGNQIIRTHDYEPHVGRIFREHLRPGMAVLDIGANIGYFSLLAASLVGASGMVYSWEPSPDNIKMLCASQLVNGFKNLEIIQAAATDRIALLRYFRSGSNGNVTEVGSGAPEDVLPAETVMGLRIDDVIPESARIGMVKIDVEGFEFKALSGAVKTLQRSRPIVVSEFSPESLKHGSGVSGREYLEFFVQLGYDLFFLRDDGPVAGTIDDVLAAYEQSGTDHIDIMAKSRRT